MMQAKKTFEEGLFQIVKNCRDSIYYFPKYYLLGEYGRGPFTNSSSGLTCSHDAGLPLE